MRSARPARRKIRCRSKRRQRRKTFSGLCMPSLIEIRVLETRGSAPREAGTRMWVGAGEIRGTIGGGNLEFTALKIAREMLLSGETQRQRRFALGDALGQCCGGSVTLSFTRTESIAVNEESEFDVMLF